MIKSERCLRLTPLPYKKGQRAESGGIKRGFIPLLEKCRVHNRSHIKLIFVALDTLVEHTKPIGEYYGGLRCDKRTSHPIRMPVCETIVKPVLDAEHDEGDDVD